MLQLKHDGLNGQIDRQANGQTIGLIFIFLQKHKKILQGRLCVVGSVSFQMDLSYAKDLLNKDLPNLVTIGT